MSASERAYQDVKARILDGSLPGGDLISEGEIAEALGMSRTPVRAAFGQLEAEGLLRLYPKRGALVVPVSASETEAVMETRWVIERYAIERVIERPGDVPARLAESVATQEGLEGADFVEADRAFHRTLVAGTGNEILLGLYDSLRDRQRRMAHATARRAEIRERTMREHGELADAIAAGNSALALQTLRLHLDNALDTIRGR
ncbi:GntR family transcriptional regulator [Solirubrobacter sp. CPCC 204708]|uniref:GntR family transcriptional regulator n=1 Tax=Solirubrobacter deserti TaxID=2282478 RepID=A0ABT4RU11_9ACTN|nr:GntR family transcriptional regulator [Solirubrobacter deserti]MBE2317254.1 GntR family transcriptional regulator [Solirubrobacter deserti]MDA0142021.1 GntR family transcriptional regulator [Solirubrobacter deserti]